MARYPGAIWKPLEADKHPAPMAKFDLFLVHTMVGSLEGTDSYFRFGNGYGYSGTESHFGLGYDGKVYQWTDTAYRADCNGDSNHRAVSVECADVGTGFPSWNLNDGSKVPAFTDAQVDALVKLTAWVCDTHNIPKVEIADSHPSRRGVGWHRKGVNSSPLFRPGYRQSGGELWSTAVGKSCPGDLRIGQVRNAVIPRVKSGAPPQEEDDMFTDKDAANLQWVRDRLGGVTPSSGYTVDDDGRAHEVPLGTPNSKPSRILATVDGNTIVREIRALAARLDKLEQPAAPPPPQ